ncbi:MAG: hypothetical protein E7637_02055 [Ruminococcaceae bacterium]|nr:hypothetical protein [Oscillospiraceae bacterium]
MKMDKEVFKQDELAVYAMRDLYQRYGYTQYRVSKFEEYDLYAKNKSFLVSENILTFTDTNGKLMALKPDVTLSIIKNIGKEDKTLHKYFYDETVYRTGAGWNGFREIMQTGLECIGDIDLYAVAEVVMLAKKSLSLISNDCVLALSHMGLVTGLLENAGIDPDGTAELLNYIETKNTHAIRKYAEQHAISSNDTEAICRITELYEPLDVALEAIAPMVRGQKMEDAYRELRGVSDLMQAYGSHDGLYLDFSVVNDMSYYNGIIFRGFINGIPDGVLSGGRYDRLLSKMGKAAGAIGFAVYLDLLEQLNRDAVVYDVDVVLSYDVSTDIAALIRAAEELRKAGKRVLIQRNGAISVRFRQRMQIGKGGLEVLEAYD